MDTAHITDYLPRNLVDEIRRVASEEGVSFSGYYRKCIYAAIESLRR
jgi:hypothetical protein